MSEFKDTLSKHIKEIKGSELAQYRKSREGKPNNPYLACDKNGRILTTEECDQRMNALKEKVRK